MTPVPGHHLTPDDLDAWLAGAPAPTALEHLTRCPACQERADTEREIVALLGALPLLTPGAGFADRVMARVSVPQPLAVRSLASIRRRIFATRRSTAIAASLLVLLLGSMAGSVVWTLGHQETLAALGGWLTAQAGQAAWLGVRGVASNFIEQPWFAGLKSLAASPGRLGLASALAMLAYVGGVLALRRLLAVPAQQWPMRASRRLLAALAVAALLGPRAAFAGTRVAPAGARTAELVHGFWRLVADVRGHASADDGPQEPRPAPQAIAPAPAGEPPVRLDDLSKPTTIEARLRAALRTREGGVRVTVPGGTARLGDFSIGSNESVPGHLLVVQGTADVYGKLLGNLVTIEGDVVLHPGGVVSGDILTLGGEVRDEGGEIGGEVRALRSSSVLEAPVRVAAAAPSALATVFRRAAGVVGVFLTLGALGFGLVLFGRPNLEVVSDTVAHSFGRAFATGLLGQLLLLPTFGMLVVGLILSVVGIVLLPFAVVVYVLLVVIGAVGGYLAVAHAMGETYTRRRLALGDLIGSPNSYRYLLVGLGALAAFWIAWSVFGWVPVAGDLIRGAAILVTWLLGTAGFGAALLSRAGIREHFAGRLIPPEALTDEYLWATPQFGVTAAKRPGSRTPTRGL